MKYFLIILITLSPFAYSSQWSGSTEVKVIYPHSTNNGVGTIYFVFEKMINPSECQKDSLIALRKDNKLSSEIYSLILAAFTSNANINYYVVSCDDAGYPILHHARISK